MLTKRQMADLAKVEAWMSTANSNTLLSFSHMTDNIAITKKLTIDRAQILAYKRMKQKGMIRG